MTDSTRYRRRIREPVIIPYNIKNKLIRDVDLKEMMNRFGIKLEVVDIELYRQALTHKSYIKKEFYNKNMEEILKYKNKMPDDVIELRDLSNERLEFFGDTVIKAVIAEYLFERYPTQDEGFMTKLKTKIENRESLARWARIMGLDEFVIISAQNEGSNNGRTNDKILEDAFESFLGALKKDTNFETCKAFIRNLLENQIDWSEILYKDCNYKDQLQRYYHSIKWEHPKFETIKEEHLQNNKRFFTVKVKDNTKNTVAIATETSIKKAQQLASKLALYKFNQLCDFQMDEEDFELLNK
jgi:dsRNA-specific ribonuclease